MLKKSKIILSSIVATIGVGAILVGTLTPVLLKSHPHSLNTFNSRMTEEDWKNNEAFEFNGNQYLKLNDAYDDLINDIGGINLQQYIGQVNNKNEDGTIIPSNNPIQRYDLSKISTAYLDANGRYTHDYNKAIKSFVNASNLVPSYYDYKGNYFLDEDDAKYSMNSFASMGIGYYKIEDAPINNELKGNIYHINPLNRTDINKFKEIAYNWLVLQNNHPNNKFNLKIVGKADSSGLIHSKLHEVSNNIVNQWSNFVSLFDNELKSELQSQLINVLKNNSIIKTEVYIKPYVLKQGPQDSEYDNIYENWDYNEQKRFMWYFDINGEKKLSIVSKPINLDNFNKLAEVFIDREAFSNNFEIRNQRFTVIADLDNIMFTPRYETAISKSDLIMNSFTSNIKILANMPHVLANTHKSAIYHQTATILRESDKYYYASGPDWANNYMLTFGIRPYIDPNVTIKFNSWNSSFNHSQSNSNISFSKFINQYLLNNQTLINNVFRRVLDNNKYVMIDLYNFLMQYKDNFYNLIKNPKSLMKQVDFKGYMPNNNSLDYSSNSLQYQYNIFNKNIVDKLILEYITPYPKPELIPLYSQKVYDKLKKELNIISSNDDYFEFNQSIDMHQITYHDKHKKNEYKMNDDYLGISNNSQYILLKNFFNIEPIQLKFKNEIIDPLINDNFKFIVTYNDMPVFEIENKLIYQEEFRKLISSVFYKNSSNRLENDQFKPELFKNISLNYNLSSNQGPSISMTNYYELKPNINHVTNDPNSDLMLKVYGTQNLLPTKNHLPIDNSEPSKMNRGIFDIISLYNQNINKLNTSKISADLAEQLKPTDYLMLFDKGSNNHIIPTKIDYCETYAGVDNLNLSLTSKNINSKIAFNNDQLNSLKERVKVFSQPAKVYFIYNNDNLVITNKIENHNNNPDFIDNPELVIENALRRTYGLAPETDYIMYKTDHNTYKHLLNNVFVLYNYQLENQTYYFDNFNMASQKLINYIKYNSYKINK